MIRNIFIIIESCRYPVKTDFSEFDMQHARINNLEYVISLRMGSDTSLRRNQLNKEIIQVASKLIS